MEYINKFEIGVQYKMSVQLEIFLCVMLSTDIPKMLRLVLIGCS